MINDNKQCVFIHIPKTGGESISAALGIKHGECRVNFLDQKRIQTKHETLTEALLRSYPRSQDYFKFSFVRNPWDRLVSLWAYYNRRKIAPVSGMEFRVFIENLVDATARVRQRYYHNLARKNNLLYPQHHFISDWFGTTAVDFVGRFENIEEDFATVCDRLSMPRRALPHNNKSVHKHYTDYYDADTQALVGKLYAKDVEAFGYTFGD